MATEKRLIDANGSYTINANDNTGYSLCFGGGIISVMDECGHCICEFDAEDAPTVDAVEVVHARWTNAMQYGDSNCVGFCSNCAAEQTAQSATALKAFHKYCRWCGAKMDREELSGEDTNDYDHCND